MPVDLSTEKTIEMINHLYQGRDMVTKDDVIQEAHHEDLGNEGMRIIDSLEPGSYSKEQLIVSISGALIDQGGHGR